VSTEKVSAKEDPIARNIEYDCGACGAEIHLPDMPVSWISIAVLKHRCPPILEGGEDGR
jgi:hypothetical protein